MYYTVAISGSGIYYCETQSNIKYRLAIIFTFSATFCSHLKKKRKNLRNRMLNRIFPLNAIKKKRKKDVTNSTDNLYNVQISTLH